MTGVSILVHPGIAHQFFLSIGLTSYVLNAPRQTVISANKEGLVSLTGKYYLTLFLPLDYDHAHFRDEVILRYIYLACRLEHL